MSTARIVYSAPDQPLADELAFELRAMGYQAILVTAHEECKHVATDKALGPRVLVWTRVAETTDEMLRLRRDAAKRSTGLRGDAIAYSKEFDESEMRFSTHAVPLRHPRKIAEVLGCEKGATLTERLAGKRVVISVHGTGDNAENYGTPKWWQAESHFNKALTEAAFGEYHWLAFKWTGANLESERQYAATRLSRLLNNLLSAGCGIGVIAHSHGGNVVRAALCDAYEKRRDEVDVVCVATPFFSYASRLRILGGTIGSTSVAFILGALVLMSFVLLGSLVFRYGMQAWYALPLLVCLSFLPISALTHFLRRLRSFRNDVAPPVRPDEIGPVGRWTCVGSVNDEAIAFLHFLAEPLRETLRERLANSAKSRADKPLKWAATAWTTVLLLGAILFWLGLRIGPERVVTHDVARDYSGMWIHPASGLAAVFDDRGHALMLRLQDAGAGFVRWWSQLPRDDVQRGLAGVLVGGVALVGAAGVIALCAWIFWMTSKLVAAGIRVGIAGAEILVQFGYSLVESIVVGRFVRRIGYGDDCDAGIVGVMDRPWANTEGTEALWLEGDVHKVLEEHVSNQYSQTMRKVRAALSATGRATASRKWKDFFACLSWDELAHTAYFRAASVSDAIVEICCRKVAILGGGVTRQSTK